MAAKNLEFKVGLFVIVGILVLVGSLYWLQGVQLREGSRSVTVKFQDAGMLKVGNIVTVAGVIKGKVNGMTLTESGVMTELLLGREVLLKEDARFIIRNYGLMGERFVAIYPGESATLLDTTVAAIGEYDSGMPEVMGLMGEMITELHELVVTFKRTVGSDSSLGKFNSAVANLERVSGSMANYMERSEGKLDQTADNFLAASKKLNRMIETNSGKIDSSITRVDRVTAGMEQLVARLDTLSLAAQEFADRLNSPDGSLQMMLEDRKLYDDLRKTADDIDALVNDIKADPRKYINLKFELF
ncbi:MAG: MlaD family protein [bacterium]|nr:MlaD family protein [bacterium]